MTDVCTLVGRRLGSEVLNLTNLVLFQMREGGRLRHFEVDATSSLQQQIDFVIRRIDGTYAASHVAVQQRYYGDDAARMLRAPVMIFQRDCDFADCFIAALCQLSPTTDYERVAADRQFPLLLFSDATQYKNALEVHLKSSVPVSVKALQPTHLAYYLSEAEKLTFLLLLVHTKTVRDAFASEAARPAKRKSRAGECWIGEGFAILSSTRVMLLPFTRWLCFGNGGAHPIVPPCSEPAYLPLPEDDCPLTVHFGRVFDELLSVEIVNHVVVNSSLKSFASVGGDVHVPVVDESNIHYAVMVVVFYFYRLTCWEAHRCSANRHIRVVCTFPQFIRLAVQVLFSGEDWERALPSELSCAKALLGEMRKVFATGHINRKEEKIDGLLYYRKNKMPSERLMTGMLQIASVIAGRDDKNTDLDVGLWLHTPLRLLNEKMMRALAPHAATTLKYPSCGVLIADCNAALMEAQMRPLLVDLNFITPEYRQFRFEVQFAHVIHPVETNSEVWCIAAMRPIEKPRVPPLRAPEVRVSELRVLKIYMYGGAMRSEAPQPMDAQAILSFMGAIINAGPELFHWLNMFRHVANEVKQPKPKKQKQPKPQPLGIDGLDSSDEDEEDSDGEEGNVFAFEMRSDFLRSDHVMSRVTAVCDPTFVPELLQAAAAVKNSDGKPDPKAADYLLSAVPWLLAPHVALTRKGFWRMVRLDPKFFNDFRATKTYLDWPRAVRDWMRDMEESVRMHDGSEDFFDEPPYLPGEDSLQAGASASASASAIPPSGPELPARIPLDDSMVRTIIESAQSDIVNNPIRALQKMAQLKAVTHLRRDKLKSCMPMLFSEGALQGMRIDATTCTIETLNLMAPLLIAKVQPQQDKLESFRVMASYFGAKLVRTDDEWLSAMCEQRLFVKGRTAAEILRPLDQQHNMFGSKLATMGAGLVKDLFDEKQEAGKAKVATLLKEAQTLNAPALDEKGRKEEEPKHKRQNTGAAASSSSSSGSRHTGAAAAAAPAESFSITHMASRDSAASAVPASAYPHTATRMDTDDSLDGEYDSQDSTRAYAAAKAESERLAKFTTHEEAEEFYTEMGAVAMDPDDWKNNSNRKRKGQ